MATRVRVWEISKGTLIGVKDAAFADYRKETDLENWIAKDPSILGEKLLVIARQLDVPGVGRLDLLCMDESGQLVIVELKRGLASREAVAQALDYASWLDGAIEEEIRAQAQAYLKQDLEVAFESHFATALPDWVCQNHRIILVAPQLDTSAERVVNYLANRHGVDINAIFFAYSRLRDEREILIRSVLVPEDVARRGSGSRRPTEATLLAMSVDQQTETLAGICRQMENVWHEELAGTSGGSFRYWAERPDGGWGMVFGINVSGKLAGSSPGKLAVWLRPETLGEVLKISEEVVREKFKGFSPFRAGFMDYVIQLDSEGGARAFVNELRVLAE